MGIKSGSNTTTIKTEALTTKQDTIRDIDDDFYKLNADQTGFYRTNYPVERLRKLGASREKLSVEDRIGLIGDIAALALAGNGTTAGLLSFLKGFQGEDNYQYVSVMFCTQLLTDSYQVSGHRLCLRLPTFAQSSRTMTK